MQTAVKEVVTSKCQSMKHSWTEMILIPADNVRMSRFSHVTYVDVQRQQLRQEKVNVIFNEAEHTVTCNDNILHPSPLHHINTQHSSSSSVSCYCTHQTLIPLWWA